MSNRAILARSAAGSVEGAAEATADGLGTGVAGDAVSAGMLPFGLDTGAVEEELGAGGTWTPHAARPAAIDPAAIARSRARREIGRSLVTSPR
jgi:hypothetical protein